MLFLLIVYNIVICFDEDTLSILQQKPAFMNNFTPF